MSELLASCSNNLFVDFFASLNISKLRKGCHELQEERSDFVHEDDGFG
jgi:hypothetical protein